MVDMTAETTDFYWADLKAVLKVVYWVARLDVKLADSSVAWKVVRMAHAWVVKWDCTKAVWMADLKAGKKAV